MSECIDDECLSIIQGISRTGKFAKLFTELENCDEDMQKQKIIKMNGLIEDMNKDECKSIFEIFSFNKLDEMIDKKKISVKNIILLLKHAGYFKVVTCVSSFCFNNSSLPRRFEKMIVEELKKEEKNENFLIELCECYLLHKERYIPSKLISNCLPFFFEVSLSKEKDEETQKKVEMALLALSCIKAQNRIEKTMYLEEIKEIIKYHQEHHNLTHLAYQSAWRFLIFRLRNGENLEEVIMNELHFVRESARELEDLTACVDWKKSKEEMKILKEVQIIRNWTDEMIDPLEHYELRKDDVARMILSLVKLCIASRDNEQGMTGDCLYILKGFAENATVSVDVFLKEGVFELILMEILESTLDDEITFYSLQICFLMFEMLNEETDNDAEEAKRKAAKMELFENLEEEGYEDAIVSFHGILVFLQEDYDDDLSLNISDYFVNV